MFTAPLAGRIAKAKAATLRSFRDGGWPREDDEDGACCFFCVLFWLV